MADKTKNINVLAFSLCNTSLVIMRLMDVIRPAAPVDCKINKEKKMIDSYMCTIVIKDVALVIYPGGHSNVKGGIRLVQKFT